MNLLKLSCALVVVIGIIACDKDDDQKNCVQADWVGTYEGTIDCEGVEEDVIVTITASGNQDIIIAYETATLSVEYDPLAPDGCDLNYSDSGGGLALSVDANLNDDHFTFEEVFTSGGTTATCEIHATR